VPRARLVRPAALSRHRAEREHLANLEQSAYGWVLPRLRRPGWRNRGI